MSFKHFVIVQGLILLCQSLNFIQAFSTHVGASEKIKESTPICCLPSECEAFVYEDWAGQLFGPIIYSNGSGRAVYSFTDKKMFQNQTGMSTWVGDEPDVFNQVDFWDYVTGVQYTVLDGTCYPMGMGGRMTPPCIWGDADDNATLISRGWFGEEGMPVVTYSYFDEQGYRIITTMFIDETETPPLCRPIQHTIVAAGEIPTQVLISLNIADIGPIKSKDVFKIPDLCKNATSTS